VRDLYQCPVPRLADLTPGMTARLPHAGQTTPSDDSTPRGPWDRPDRVDIPGIAQPAVRSVAPASANEAEKLGPARPFLQIWYRCCHVYGRLQKNDEATHYVGNCPKCRAQLKVAIGQGGTSRRLFEAR